MVSSARDLGLLLLLLGALTALLPALVEAQIPGGFQTLNRDSPEVKEIVIQAMAKLNSESNDPNWLKVDRILCAKAQVVSGMHYVITGKLRETTCPKSQSPESCECYNSVTAGKILVCELDIWSKSWINFLKVTKTCPPSNQLK